MKIYYEPPEGIDIIEEQLEEVTSAIELHPKLVPVIKPLLDLCRDLFNKRAVCSMELVKYQLMWSLRFLEEEIEFLRQFSKIEGKMTYTNQIKRIVEESKNFKVTDYLNC